MINGIVKLTTAARRSVLVPSSNLCREGPPLVPLQAQTYALSRRPLSSASRPFITKPARPSLFPTATIVLARRREMISASWSLRRTSNTIAFPWEKRQKRVGGMSIAPVCRRRHTLSDCAARAESWGLPRLPRTVSVSIQVRAGCGIEG